MFICLFQFGCFYFFGLVSEAAFKEIPLLAILPVAMMLLNFLLIADRRKSGDVIVAYFRIAYDQDMAKSPKWNYLLPKFRKKFHLLNKGVSTKMIPQRFDFHVAIWLSFFVLSIICAGMFVGITNLAMPYQIFVFAVVIISYASVLKYHYRLSDRKEQLLEAWTMVLSEEFPESNRDCAKCLISW